MIRAAREKREAAATDFLTETTRPSTPFQQADDEVGGDCDCRDDRLIRAGAPDGEVVDV